VRGVKAQAYTRKATALVAPRRRNATRCGLLPPLPPRPQADEAGAEQHKRGGFGPYGGGYGPSRPTAMCTRRWRRPEPEVRTQILDVPESPLAGSAFPILLDGLVLDVHGNLYLTILTWNAVVRLMVESKAQETVAVFDSQGQAPRRLRSTRRSVWRSARAPANSRTSSSRTGDGWPASSRRCHLGGRHGPDRPWSKCLPACRAGRFIRRAEQNHGRRPVISGRGPKPVRSEVGSSSLLPSTTGRRMERPGCSRTLSATARRAARGRAWR